VIGAHTQAIADVLYDCYLALMRDGYPLTREKIEREVDRMLSGNFRDWLGHAKQ
jgi:hypothetical protein